MSVLTKIPVIRALVAAIEKRNFKKKWRSLNRHNETKAGERLFPVDIVKVGKGTYGTLNVQTMYAAPGEEVSIGNYVSIAPNVRFMLGMNHQIQTVTTFPFHSKLIKRSAVDAICKGPIYIEDEVWIGADSIIFSGIRVGKGAIIATGSIVTKDVPPYAIVGGNPARLIRYRFTDDIIEIIKPIHFADFPAEWIKENINQVYKVIETREDALQFKALADSYVKNRK